MDLRRVGSLAKNPLVELLVIAAAFVGVFGPLGYWLRDLWALPKYQPYILATTSVFAMLCAYAIGRTQGARKSTGQILILRDNKAMEDRVRALVSNNAAKIKRVILVQYSGQKIVDTINAIWEGTDADIDLYLVDPKGDAIGGYQAARIERTLAQLKNVDLREAKGHGAITTYTYAAPGAQRIALIEGVAIYVGAYFYMYKLTDGPTPALDPRGHTQPILEIPYEHPDYEMYAQSVREMVDNWIAHGVARQREEPIRKKGSR